MLGAETQRRPTRSRNRNPSGKQLCARQCAHQQFKFTKIHRQCKNFYEKFEQSYQKFIKTHQNFLKNTIKNSKNLLQIQEYLLIKKIEIKLTGAHSKNSQLFPPRCVSPRQSVALRRAPYVMPSPISNDLIPAKALLLAFYSKM